MKTDFLNNSSVADFQRRLHKLFKPHKLHFRNLKKGLPKKSSNNNGSVTIWLLSPPFWREKLKHVNARAKSIFFLPSLNPAKFSIKQEMINRLVHPMFLTSLKLGESHESSTEVALDVVLKMLVTTWAKLVCSSSHVGMFWTEKVALVWSEEKIFEHAQVRTAARLQQQLSLLCTATQYSTQLLVTTETD